jgi:hypothetical protein
MCAMLTMFSNVINYSIAVRHVSVAAVGNAAKYLGEALQRILGNTERYKAGISGPERQPGTGRIPPAGRGIDMRNQSAERAARLGVVDAKQHMRAEIRCRPLPKHGRLDLIQLDRRRCAGVPRRKKGRRRLAPRRDATREMQPVPMRP